MIVRMIRCFLRFIKRIFCPGNFILSNIMLFLMISSYFIDCYIEFKYSALMTTIDLIASNLTAIKSYSDTISNDSFVYFISNHTEYPLLTDNEFGVQAHAAILKRSIDYCQWLEEGFDSTDKITRTRRYMKVWVKEIINSSEFMDIRYHNPTFKFSFSDAMVHAESISIGPYTINANIYKKNKNNFMPFVPDINQSTILPNFNTSFVYVGDGYFYSNYNKSQNIAPPYKKSEDCTPGDIRIRITQFSPQIVSVLGVYSIETNEINTKFVNNFEIGSLESGNVTLNNLMISRFKKLQVFTMITRFLTFISISFYIIEQSTTQIESIVKFIFASFFVLIIRYLIWNDRRFIRLCFSLIFVLFNLVLFLQ